jgi:hypothetical protein
MKRIFAIVLAAVAGAALFGGLVYAVLVVAHVSDPAATTVYGLTLRRLWATAAAAVALVGVVIGGVALARTARRFESASSVLWDNSRGSMAMRHVTGKVEDDEQNDHGDGGDPQHVDPFRGVRGADRLHAHSLGSRNRDGRGLSRRRLLR